jgi:pyridoxal biosynthesis lyase PdxS
VLARVSEQLGEAMVGIETAKLAKDELLQTRGW